MSVLRDPPPTLAIVVPVRHDTAALRALLQRPRHPGDSWFVVSGADEDAALQEVRRAHQDICWLVSAPGRGCQLATGLAEVTADWVLILHADTHLTDGWRDEVTRADRGASNQWGCFRLRLDSPAWQARLIEVAVRVRVRLLRLPYGDQGMFFRRTTLEALGGIPRVPLMEDVILARRFGRLGAPFSSSLPAITSARRWEQDGWWRRSARNLWVLTQFVLGVPPERLAAAYDGTKS